MTELILCQQKISFNQFHFSQLWLEESWNRNVANFYILSKIAKKNVALNWKSQEQRNPGTNRLKFLSDNQCMENFKESKQCRRNSFSQENSSKGKSRERSWPRLSMSSTQSVTNRGILDPSRLKVSRNKSEISFIIKIKFHPNHFIIIITINVNCENTWGIHEDGTGVLISRRKCENHLPIDGRPE